MPPKRIGSGTLGWHLPPLYLYCAWELRGCFYFLRASHSLKARRLRTIKEIEKVMVSRTMQGHAIETHWFWYFRMAFAAPVFQGLAIEPHTRRTTALEAQF